MRVQHSGVQRTERPVPTAAGVVANEDVQVAECVDGGLHQPVRRLGRSQVRIETAETGTVSQRFRDAVGNRLRAGGVGAPRLVSVVGDVLVHEKACPQRSQPARRGVPDARTPARAGDQSGASTQWQGSLSGDRISKAHVSSVSFRSATRTLRTVGRVSPRLSRSVVV
jgi:hypothetical protein